LGEAVVQKGKRSGRCLVLYEDWMLGFGALDLRRFHLLGLLTKQRDIRPWDTRNSGAQTPQPLYHTRIEWAAVNRAI
jgi:hypothetical protein